MKPNIFVSHMHEDSDLALALKEEISELLLDGIDFFVSSDGSCIRGGDKWLNKIEEALEKSAIFLIICNEFSISRPWINFEAGGAWLKKIRVIPLCCGSLKRDDLPEPLRSLQSFSLSDPEHITSLLKIISEVAKLRMPEFNPENIVEKLKDIDRKRSGSKTDEIKEAFRTVSYYVDSEVLPENRETVLDAVTKTVTPLRQMQQRLKDWGGEAEEWIKDFHAGINDYSRIYATDVMGRSSIGSPQFDRYLRIQYSAKLKASSNLSQPHFPLYFSKSVIDAIQRTGWRPDSSLWQPPTESTGGTYAGLEIVRILIRPLTDLDDWEKNALHVIDFDHKLHGIPLFVVDPSRLKDEEKIDFAIGFGCEGRVKRCYEFSGEKGEVLGQTTRRGKKLSEIFYKILLDPTLKTVSEYLGNVMIKNPEKSTEFSLEYDKFRRYSKQIVDFILNKVIPNTDKAGLDVGCGTGNYTFPIAEKFGKTIGIDLNEKILEVAREKAKKHGKKFVDFIKADAVATPFEPESFDAIWSVSTIHYLKGRRQWHFLKECHRILKIGGIIVIDIGEFLEQHPSLWIKEYFPSLKERYKNSLFSKNDYISWLDEIGFRCIQCIPLEYHTGEKDYFLRAGQHDPKLYLRDWFVKANPAFREMSHSELTNGQDDIRRDMELGEINDLINRCQRQATMDGDIGFIVAKR